MPIPPVKEVLTPQSQQRSETLGEKYPPLNAMSDSTVAAVSASHTGQTGGNAIFATSNTGDGVHAQTSGPNGSGVAGLHSAGGNGVYGKSSGNAGYFEGNVTITQDLTVGGDVLLPGADCAEQFDLADGLELEPGTLVVIAEGGGVVASSRAYDRNVVGVVAGAGCYRPGIVLDSAETGCHRAKISLVGKVFCKADASYGPIEAGDLLTSSPTPGHAMRATNSSRAFGTVVGKSLGRLEGNQGLIPIIIALQ